MRPYRIAQGTRLSAFWWPKQEGYPKKKRGDIRLHGLTRWPSGKELTCQGRRLKRRGFYLWSGRSPGGGHGNPLQYACLEHPMDRGAWRATVHRVIESQTGQKSLSDPWIHTAESLYSRNGHNTVKQIFSTKNLKILKIAYLYQLFH